MFRWKLHEVGLYPDFWYHYWRSEDAGIGPVEPHRGKLFYICSRDEIFIRMISSSEEAFKYLWNDATLPGGRYVWRTADQSCHYLKQGVGVVILVTSSGDLILPTLRWHWTPMKVYVPVSGRLPGYYQMRERLYRKCKRFDVVPGPPDGRRVMWYHRLMSWVMHLWRRRKYGGQEM